MGVVSFQVRTPSSADEDGMNSGELVAGIEATGDVRQDKT